MKICPNCNAQNYDNAQVCFHCGFPFDQCHVYYNQQQRPQNSSYISMPFPQNSYLGQKNNPELFIRF